MIFFFAVQPRNDMINYLERSAAGAQPKGPDVPEQSLSRFVFLRFLVSNSRPLVGSGGPVP